MEKNTQNESMQQTSQPEKKHVSKLETVLSGIIIVVGFKVVGIIPALIGVAVGTALCKYFGKNNPDKTWVPFAAYGLGAVAALVCSFIFGFILYSVL